MSTLGDVLRRHGLTVVTDTPVAGRPGTFAPRGVLLHHTASTAPDANQLSLLKRGRADLPGPLCHVYVRVDGSGVDVISEGRANHAGRGDDGTDGNASTLGIEVGASGAHPITGRAYTTMVAAAAALCDHLGVGADRVRLHREHAPSRKVDIRNDGAHVRRDVAAALTGEDDDMPLTDADVSRIAAAVWAMTVATDEDGTGGPLPASRALSRAYSQARIAAVRAARVGKAMPSMDVPSSVGKASTADGECPAVLG